MEPPSGRGSPSIKIEGSELFAQLGAPETGARAAPAGSPTKHAGATVLCRVCLSARCKCGAARTARQALHPTAHHSAAASGDEEVAALVCAEAIAAALAARPADAAPLTPPPVSDCPPRPAPAPLGEAGQAHTLTRAEALAGLKAISPGWVVPSPAVTGRKALFVSLGAGAPVQLEPSARAAAAAPAARAPASEPWNTSVPALARAGAPAQRWGKRADTKKARLS